ncbi:MAG TPA: peptidoglycan editing factor PgeF [Thermoanaerobaculia bacterium]|nr:peptidoglycan editing factor PgeF [Thermoanaerobaculia bacterium]
MPNALFIASHSPAGVIAAVSERGVAPAETPSPTEFLARRFAAELGVPELPIVRATQVHGDRVVVVESSPEAGETVDAGRCDAIVTRLTRVGLVVQTADCVPVLFASDGAIGAVHAGWRGAAAGVVGAAAEAFLGLTGDRTTARAWLGPSIGACCYDVGSEVANRFPEDLARPSREGKFFLDLSAVVRRQLEEAGFPPGKVLAYRGCTMCDGERSASYRRDRENAGRMIALVARLGAADGGT